jgi:hypothetical protein
MAPNTAALFVAMLAINGLDSLDPKQVMPITVVKLYKNPISKRKWINQENSQTKII